MMKLEAIGHPKLPVVEEPHAFPQLGFQTNTSHLVGEVSRVPLTHLLPIRLILALD